MPAENLQGITTEDGWLIRERLQQSPSATGGYFSVGYIAVDPNGKEAFLKALNMGLAFNDTNTLEYHLKLFNFEREILNACRDSKLSRVVVPIGDGKVQSPIGQPPFNQVPFILFEKATGDIRHPEAQWAITDSISYLLILRQTATGLEQLHRNGVVHQDLKPSNLLAYANEGIKISDLGTAFSESLDSPRDIELIAGARSYASLDAHYRNSAPDKQQRIALDFYLLGSLIFFFFTGVNATAALTTKLNIKGVNLSGDFAQDLPFIQLAFDEVVENLVSEVESTLPGLGKEIANTATELCHPNPELRGVKKLLGRGQNALDMRRYVSRFDLLLRKADLAK